jgi:hypothetical protein
VPSLAVAVDDAERVDQITLLADAKAIFAAAQITPTVDLAASTRRQIIGSGLSCDGTTITRENARKSIAAQVGLAHKASPTVGSQKAAFAAVLYTEMPHTRELLSTGIITEWRATILVRETGGLTAKQRRRIDAELCSSPDTLATSGDRTVAARAKALASKMNPKAVRRRLRKRTSDRRVSTRPAPDLMVYLTTLLPMKQAITVYATLRRDADSLIATGNAEGRTRDQIMADLLVERTSGTAAASDVPVELVLVMSDAALMGGGDEAAHVLGYGPIPASIAREWVQDADAQVTLRRVYAHPATGALTAVESRSRCFTTGMKRLIDIRDQVCRTPWCEAPIRHRDHLIPDHQGGPTAAQNGAGLCVACNQVKNTPGWSTTPTTTGGRLHEYEIVTPTGHRHTSTAPSLPRPDAA